MYIRQLLAQRHLHPQINFCLTAFAATTISGLLLQLPTFSNTPTIAMAASVLLLVPGFPLINAVADMFKGHINTGLASLGDRQSADTGYLRRRRDGTDDLGATRMGVIEFLLALAQDMIRRHSCGRLCDGVQRSRAGVTLVCAAWCDRSWFPNDLNDQRVEY